MAFQSSVTILIPTFNRANVLHKTLAAWLEVDRTGLDCEIVIIANNCTDSTVEVVRSYEAQLPLRLLFESRPGKNCALNRALREVMLRELVAFTDDDTSPAPDWLLQIVSASERWPQVSVFGGSVEVLWPRGLPPVWAKAPWIQEFGYSFHHYSDQEQFYTHPACPFGPNFWVRRSVFKKVPFFDETIGPRPRARKMGSETSFLLELHRSGFKQLFCPNVRAVHRIADHECQIGALRRRGFTFGRGQVRLHRWHRAEVYQQSRILWVVVCTADYIVTALQFVIGASRFTPRARCEATVRSMIRFGQLWETQLLAWDYFRGNRARNVLGQDLLIPENISSNFAAQEGNQPASDGRICSFSTARPQGPKSEP